MKRLISVAPMMDCTDRHDRYFLRLISKNVMLYTEMIVSDAILKGDRNYLLKFNPFEKPLGLQVGGSSPKDLAEVVKIAEGYGYDEINLNLGCPSRKVQKNKFGACLMQHPDLVSECVYQMNKNTRLPISIKTRIGINQTEDFEVLNNFINKIKSAGSKIFIIHARRAILEKLTPKENLNIPPLNYDFVYKIKNLYKKDTVILNGGISKVEEINKHLKKVDGVMIGRAAYHSPYFLAEIEKKIFKNKNILTRPEIIQNMIPYIRDEIQKGTRLNKIMRHTLGLFHGERGSSNWKRYLTENMCVRNADVQKIDHIMDKIKSNYTTTSIGR